MAILTEMSFLFETHYLEKGGEIAGIRKDMRKLSIEQAAANPAIKYMDELRPISAGEDYLDAWDFGQRLKAPADMVRLFCKFYSRKFRTFVDTLPFQEIHKEVFEYAMKKGVYMMCCHEHPTEPPILFSTPSFSMSGEGDYVSISCNLGGNIVEYIKKKRDQWGEPGPLTVRERYESRLKPGEKNLFLRH